MNNIFRFAVLGLITTAVPTFAAPASEKAQKPISLLALAGYSPLTGEGVTITLSDRSLPIPESAQIFMPGLVHDFDVLNLVNELRSAGAKGITIGGVRLTNQSSIICVGPKILVDKKPIVVPVRIEAVGNAALLKARLELKGSIFDSFKKDGPRAQLQTANKLRLAAAPLPSNLKAVPTSD